MKLDLVKLNLIDAEKGATYLKEPAILDMMCSAFLVRKKLTLPIVTTWIEWHREGNLIASSGDKGVKFFDIRQRGVAKCLSNIHSSEKIF